jgi:glycyl-tRNA synthetase beta chain
MGGLYLKDTGATEGVWKGVYAHYEPKGFVESEHMHPVAVLLSLADKLDNIAGLIGKGVKVSSSKDPFGIRRDASAIVRLIHDHRLDFDLWEAVMFSLSLYQWPEPESLLKQIKALFTSRLEQILKEQLGIRYDLVNSLLASPEPRILGLFERAEQIGPLLSNQASLELIVLHKRLKNITHNCQGIEINPKLFRHGTEEMLYEVFSETAEPFDRLIHERRFAEACSLMLELKPIIDSYFDDIMVMDPDLLVRENRLSQLAQLAARIDSIIDFSLIVEQDNSTGLPAL